MEEKINQYKKERLLIKIKLVLLNALFIYLLLRLNLYFVFIIAIMVMLIPVSWILFIIINNKLLMKFDYIISRDCDSNLYYWVYKELIKKYPKDSTIIQNYSYALIHNENDYTELKQFVDTYKNYKTHIFYLRADYIVSNPELKEEKFNKYYDSSKRFCEKNYQKTKKNFWKIALVFVEGEKAFLNKDYDETLAIYQSMSESESNFNKVKLEFMKGKCLLELSRIKEAIEKFNYVVKYGNTLRIYNEANKIKHEIERGNVK